MIRLVIFIIEIVLAAILGGILGYAMNPGQLKSRIQTLILLTVGSTVFVGAASGSASSQDGLSQTILMAGIIIATGLLTAGFVAGDSNPSSRLTYFGSFWMAIAVGILIGMGSLIKAILLTGLAYYVLRYLPGIFHEDKITQPAEEDDI